MPLTATLNISYRSLLAVQLEILAYLGSFACLRELQRRAKILVYLWLDDIVQAADKRAERSDGLPFLAVVNYLVEQGRDSEHGKMYLDFLAEHGLYSYDLAVLYNLNEEVCGKLFRAFGGPDG